MIKNSYLLLAMLPFLFACNTNNQKEGIKNSTYEKKSIDTTNTLKKTPPKKEKEKRPKRFPSETDTTQSNETTEQFLNSFDTVSFGKTFVSIKEVYPTLQVLSEENSNIPTSQKLTEATSWIDILNKKAKVEFHFRNDSLYSYFLTITEPTYEEAEKTHAFLQNYYTQKYGECLVQSVEEESKFSETCYWKVKDRYLPLRYDVNKGIISWGYQVRQPKNASE